MYYHFDGNWYQSDIKGSWLIRPIFGKKIVNVSVAELESNATKFQLSPNPANNTFRLEFENIKNNIYQYQIFNSLGAIIQKEKIKSSKKIDISGLSAGVYFVRLLDTENNSSSVEKLFVQ